MNKSGFFVFEGVEGSGKTTIIESVFNNLKSINIDVIKTREPGGTELGQTIRNTLLNKNNYQINPISELLLFFADRAQHIDEIIKPAISQKKLVLCDRFIYSTIAYQVFGRGLDRSLVDQLCQIVLGTFTPNGVILLDIDPIESLKRVKSRAEFDRFESEKIEFHDRIRNGYLSLAKELPDLFLVLDSKKPVKELEESVVKFILNKAYE